MGFGNRPTTQSTRPGRGRRGPPAWLIFLLGVAFVMGAFYLWQGVNDFIQTEGRGILESRTLQAEVSTATAIQITLRAGDVRVTGLPTGTPIPECMDFIVIVERANIREEPQVQGQFIQTVDEGNTLCALSISGDWYLLDLNPNTRRIETGYIREDLVEAINPTPTPSNTFTPAPTVTNLPTNTPSITPTPRPTNTVNPDVTNTPTPSPTATPTAPNISA